MALLAGVRVQAPEAHMVTRIALAAVLLWQVTIAVTLLPQPQPANVPLPADTSPGIAGLLLPTEPQRPVCLPIMIRMGWDGCPIVLR